MGSDEQLRSLLHALSSAPPGGVVELPSGRFVLELPLEIRKGLHIRADGVTLVAPEGQAALKISAAEPVVVEGLRIEASTAPGVESANGKLTLRSIDLCGPGYTPEREGMHGVWARGGELVVHGGSFSGFDYGVCVDAGADARLEGVVARQNDGGIAVKGNARGFLARVTCEENRLGVVFHEGGGGEVSLSTLSKNREAGVAIIEDAEVTVTDCIAEDNGADGVYAAGGGGVVSIVRNVIRRSGRHGIYVGGQFAGQLVGNVIDVSGRIGIWAHESSSGEARHNFVSRSQENGFQTVGMDLRDNVSLRNSWGGVAITDGSTGTAAYNLAARNEQNGLFITDEPKPTVAHNELIENKYNGIICSKGSAGVVRRNYCARNEYSGITVADDAEPLVEDNTLEGNEVNGFCALGESQPVVRNNLALENACDGFRLDDSSRAVLEGNIARENQEDGISILKRAAPTVRGNQCIENSDAAIRVVGDDARPKLAKNRFVDNGDDEVVRVEAPDEDEDADDDDDEAED